MNTTQALQFLKEYGAMSVSEKSLCTHQYDDVRQFFLENPNPECIPLFLNSFGDTRQCAFGVYQLVEDVIQKFTAEEVIPHLRGSLQSDREHIRYWCAQIASSFPDTSLIEPLVNLLKDPSRDVRYFSILALDQIDGPRISESFRDAIETETDPENQDLLRTAIANRGN